MHTTNRNCRSHSRSGSRNNEPTTPAKDFKSKSVLISAEEWDSVSLQFGKAMPASSYSAITQNIFLGLMFGSVPKATNSDRPVITRAKVYEKFGVNARSAIDYIKLGENADLVLGTIERAIKTGEPISQAKILELLDAHRVLKGALNFRVKYLQRMFYGLCKWE